MVRIVTKNQLLRLPFRALRKIANAVIAQMERTVFETKKSLINEDKALLREHYMKMKNY